MPFASTCQRTAYRKCELGRCDVPNPVSSFWAKGPRSVRRKLSGPLWRRNVLSACEMPVSRPRTWTQPQAASTRLRRQRLLGTEEAEKEGEEEKADQKRYLRAHVAEARNDVWLDRPADGLD